MDSELFDARLQLWSKRCVHFLDILLNKIQPDVLHFWNNSSKIYIAAYVTFRLILCYFIDIYNRIIITSFWRQNSKSAMKIHWYMYLQIYLIELTELLYFPFTCVLYDFDSTIRLKNYRLVIYFDVNLLNLYDLIIYCHLF